MANHSFNTRRTLREMIKRYLRGNASSQETAFLEKYYQQFEKEEGITEKLSEAERDSLGAKMETAIFRKMETHPPLRKISYYRWAAAAIFLAAIIMAALYFLPGKKPSPQVAKQSPAVTNDLEPGGNKAILVLADGSKINLDNAGNGEISQQNGTVIHKTKDGQVVYDLSSVSTTSAVAYNTIQTPAGGEYQVILADGTKVWLNAGSSLRFPTTFVDAERIVQLTGEGYFEVAKNAAKPFKFMVEGMEVKVLGTHFNIMAYAGESSIKTTLIEGSVNIRKNEKERLLKPGQQASIGSSGEIGISEADVEKAIAWKNGYFKFTNDDVQSVMNQLARWYDMDVVYAGNTPKDQFSGKIRRNVKASKALEWLQQTGLRFKIEGQKVTVFEN